MQNSASGQGLERSNSTASSTYSFDVGDEKAGGGGAAAAGAAGLTRGNTLAVAAPGGVARGNTVRQYNQQEKGFPFENGDGLREDGRGYRGF